MTKTESVLGGKRFDMVWILAFGLASSIWCVTAARTIGATFDEPTYLENGMHFWRTGSHRTLMKLGTMPLPVDLQTLPLAIAERIRGTNWDLDTDFHTLLPRMRHGNLLFWWLLLISAFRIGRDVAGSWGGRLAVAALACEPNMLAHAALATTDIAITATVLTFALYYHRGRDQAWSRRVGLPGIWYGVALLSKASALAFVPLVMVGIELARFIQQWSDESNRLPELTGFTPSIGHSGRGYLRKWVLECGIIGIIGLAVAVLGVGSDFQPDESFIRWAQSLPEGRNHTFWVWTAEHLRIFGNGIEGLVMQIKHNFRGHGQYLLGESSEKPFWYYFPVVFSIKLTVPVLFGVLILFFRPTWLKDNWPMACAAILLAFSMTCRVQIGIRLQLLAVAFVIVALAAGIAQSLTHVQLRRPLTAASAIGIAWMGVSSALAWPNGLCYVNELWGGAQEGYRLVSDGNYDWGQGLPELAKWQRSRNISDLDVWYYGRDPEIKRMPVRDLPLHCVTLRQPDDMATYCWGRHLAVGTTLRYGLPLNDAHRHALEFLRRREPVAQTSTFLIYDFTDLGPPKQAIETAERSAK
ncbi:MAG: ArnT family glycosyltransferase [Gemmataceae bacterium]